MTKKRHAQLVRAARAGGRARARKLSPLKLRALALHAARCRWAFDKQDLSL